MTATRIGRTTLIVCLGAAWMVGAWLLTRTTVPDLELGGADAHRWFSDAQIARAERYERFDYALWALELVATLAVLVILARRGPRLANSIALGRIGTGVILGMVMLVTLWAVSVPFGIAHQWWAARHGLAEHAYHEWLVAPWAELSFSALLALVARRRARLCSAGRVVRVPLRLRRAGRDGPDYRPSRPAGGPDARTGGRRRGNAGAGAGRQRRHEAGERVRNGLRSLDPRRPLGHTDRRQVL